MEERREKRISFIETRRGELQWSQKTPKLGQMPTFDQHSRVQNSKPCPTHRRQTRNSSFQESRKCLVTPCACVHPFGSRCYTPSSSEKAETRAHAGPGAASRVPLPLRMRSGLASCCEAERKDGFFFFLVPAPLLPPPATYWARDRARLGGFVLLAGARASLLARCGGAGGGHRSGP